MIYKQKLTKIGNSVGAILPKALLDSLNLKSGSDIYVEKIQNKIVLGENTTPSVSAEFLAIAEKVGKKYKGAFKELAAK